MDKGNDRDGRTRKRRKSNNKRMGNIVNTKRIGSIVLN